MFVDVGGFIGFDFFDPSCDIKNTCICRIIIAILNITLQRSIFLPSRICTITASGMWKVPDRNTGFRLNILGTDSSVPTKKEFQRDVSVCFTC